MLTQLSTLKSRLANDALDVQFDALLTTAIDAVSFRFDKETNRTLARTADTAFEFSADDASSSATILETNAQICSNSFMAGAKRTSPTLPSPGPIPRLSCIINLGGIISRLI